jgi:hypothetical protein
MDRTGVRTSADGTRRQGALGGRRRGRFAARLMMGVSWAACLIIPVKEFDSAWATLICAGRTEAGHIFPSDRRNCVRIFVSACLRGQLDVGGRMPTGVGTGLSLDTRRVCAALVPASRLPGLLVGLLRNLMPAPQQGSSTVAKRGLGWLLPRTAALHMPPARSHRFPPTQPGRECRGF